MKKILSILFLLQACYLLTAQPVHMGIDNIESGDNIANYPNLYYEIQIADLNRLTQIELFYNETVQEYIDAFLSVRNEEYLIFRARSEFFFPLIEKYLLQYNIPDEIKYLAVLESGLQPEACSPSNALGLWQFKKETGIHCGLKINSTQDERLDPELSTIAACKYLKSLYNNFHNWELSLLAYNTGPTRLRDAIQMNGGRTGYSYLHPFLSLPAKRYLPALIAIIYLFENHENHIR